MPHFSAHKNGEGTLSLWWDTAHPPKLESLSFDLEVDVCIVGAGIAGLTTAYLLLREGKTVAVLDAHEMASGQTGRTTAHFSAVLGDRYFELEKYHGEKGMRQVAQSHTAAIDLVEKIVQDEGIDCDFERVTGHLFAPPETPAGTLDREFSACKRAGLKGVTMEEKVPIDSFYFGPALSFPNQAQLHPLKYLKGLVDCILREGGKIYPMSPVDHVQGGKNACVRVRGGHVVKAKSVVVATNTPVNDLFVIHTKQAAYRSYVLGVRIPKASVPKGLYWDTLDPYHYFRVQPLGKDEDILIVGGEDHKTGQNDEPNGCFYRLEEWTRRRFPQAGAIEYRWSGQVMEPVDGLAYLGHNPLDKNNVYIITGDAGNGMTHGTIGGILVTDQIMGRENSWEGLYNPSRSPLRNGHEYLRENANVAAQYADWFSELGPDHFGSIPLGEGVVFSQGLKKVAAYKDLKGNVELHSAVCNHLGGIVCWNTVEKSWDCPCHGARYDCHGRVIEGPASSDLKSLNDLSDFKQFMEGYHERIPSRHQPKGPNGILDQASLSQL